MRTKQQEIDVAVHELADLVVNWGGYADDPDEQQRRSAERDEIERKIRKAIEPTES